VQTKVMRCNNREKSMKKVQFHENYTTIQ